LKRLSIIGIVKYTIIPITVGIIINTLFTGGASAAGGADTRLGMDIATSL
jgi:hypothetical protein